MRVKEEIQKDPFSRGHLMGLLLCICAREKRKDFGRFPSQGHILHASLAKRAVGCQTVLK